MDSTPLGSLTSALEAAAAELPIVSLRPRPGEEILAADSPGLHQIRRAKSIPDLSATLRALARDRALRRAEGQRARLTVQPHLEADWSDIDPAARTHGELPTGHLPMHGPLDVALALPP